jgi:hypothetical protein
LRVGDSLGQGMAEVESGVAGSEHRGGVATVESSPIRVGMQRSWSGSSIDR